MKTVAMKFAFVALIALLSLCICSCKSLGSPESEQTGIRRVIIDTDTGADDACALILAAKCSDIELLGVTVLVGNVDLEQSTRNALMALEIAGCDAPVYKGASETFSGENKVVFSVFGTDGMGDAGIINPQGSAEEGDAVEFILQSIKQYPGEVEIIALGPATNVAKAIERDPETMKDVKMIWSMGTAGLGHGNASPVAEFNVYADADAYKVLLDSGLPITIVGLDMCDGDSLWDDSDFEKLGRTNEIGAFISASFCKIREFYAANGSDGTVMNCDPMVVMCALHPGFVNSTIQCHGSCIVDEGETYAQVLFYKEGFTYDMATNDYEYNVTLVTDVDGKDYFNNYLKAIR